MNKIKELAFRCYEYNIEMCLNINKKYSDKKVKLVRLGLRSPYMILRWAFCVFYENTIGKYRVSNYNALDRKKDYNDELTVVAIAKNEAPYIREWVAYHLTVGVSKIYIYDNVSEDNLKEVLADFISEGKVVYTYYPGKNMQLAAYNDAIKKYKNVTRYMAFIDCDEFLLSPQNERLPDLVKRLIEQVPNAAGLGVNWCLYGSSGYENKQPGILIETYLYRAHEMDWPNFHIKTIVNPRLVKEYISPHFPVYVLGGWSVDSEGLRQRLWYNHNVNFDTIRCNHYFCKSREEFIQKRNRGMADRQNKYDLKKFDEYDLNDVYDDTMLKYVDAVKRMI